jgi:hypothetical protein
VRPSSAKAIAALVAGILTAFAVSPGAALADDSLLCVLLGICAPSPPPPPPTTTVPTTTPTTPTTTTPTTTTPTTTPTTTTATQPPERQCLPGVGDVGKRAVGAIRLGDGYEEVFRSAGVQPRRVAVGNLGYCVKGGGRVDVSFSRGRAALIVARAMGYRYQGFAPGTSTKRLHKGKLGAKRAGSRAFRIGKVLIGSEDGFVTYVAPARGALLHDRSLLGKHLKRTGVR